MPTADLVSEISLAPMPVMVNMDIDNDLVGRKPGERAAILVRTASSSPTVPWVSACRS